MSRRKATYLHGESVVIRERIFWSQTASEDFESKLVSSFGVKGIPEYRIHEVLVEGRASIEVVYGKEGSGGSESSSIERGAK